MVDLIAEARQARVPMWGPSFDRMMDKEESDFSDLDEWFGIEDNEPYAVTPVGKEELKEMIIAERETFLTEIRNRSANTPDFAEMHSEADKFIVFVYGTLKKGFNNHGLLQTAEYLGLARSVKESYTMYSGGFPVAFDETEGFSNLSKGSIHGEAYAVDIYTMAALDRLENNGVMYHRKKIPVTLLQQKDENSMRSIVRFASTYFGCRRFWKNIKDADLMLPVSVNNRNSLCWTRKGA